MIALADPAGGEPHDAYHRFLRDGAWHMNGLWRLLAIYAVRQFAPTGGRPEPVVVTLCITPPWGSMPIAVPVNARLHKKEDPITTIEHAAQMLRELATWLPDRKLHLCADGAYACLAGADLTRTHVTSRMPRDAALSDHACRPRPASVVGPAPKATGSPVHLSSPLEPTDVTEAR